MVICGNVCRFKGIVCELATENGYCKVTACARHSVADTITYTNANPVLVIPSGYVEVVRCKDCKHRPNKPDRASEDALGGFDIEFPDGGCPCQCEDGYYNWYPEDDWFCGNGERRK